MGQKEEGVKENLCFNSFHLLHQMHCIVNIRIINYWCVIMLPCTRNDFTFYLISNFSAIHTPQFSHIGYMVYINWNNLYIYMFSSSRLPDLVLKQSRQHFWNIPILKVMIFLYFLKEFEDFEWRWLLLCFWAHKWFFNKRH